MRVALALPAGAIVGGVLATAVYFIVARLHFGVGAEDPEPIPAAFVGSLICGIGLVAASPLWLLLHSLRLRDWYVATMFGAALPIIAAVALAVATVAVHRIAPPVAYAYPRLALLLLMAGATGGVVGLAVWRIAYRRAP
ncbi:MAG: hypothetical protein ACHP7N_18065 [Caulobacterales bacterium]